jgi:hypothetical protein
MPNQTSGMTPEIEAEIKRLVGSTAAEIDDPQVAAQLRHRAREEARIRAHSCMLGRFRVHR